MTPIEIILSLFAAVPSSLVLANIGYGSKLNKNKKVLKAIPYFQDLSAEDQAEEVITKFNKAKLSDSIQKGKFSIENSSKRIETLSKGIDDLQKTVSLQEKNLLPNNDAMSREVFSLKKGINALLDERTTLAESYLSLLMKQNPSLVEQYKKEKAIQDEKARLAREKAEREALLERQRQEAEAKRQRIARRKQEEEEEERRRKRRREEEEEEERRRSSYSSSSSSSWGSSDSSSSSSSSWGSGDGGGFSGGGSSDSY